MRDNEVLNSRRQDGRELRSAGKFFLGMTLVRGDVVSSGGSLYAYRGPDGEVQAAPPNPSLYDFLIGNVGTALAGAEIVARINLRLGLIHRVCVGEIDIHREGYFTSKLALAHDCSPARPQAAAVACDRLPTAGYRASSPR